MIVTFGSVYAEPLLLPVPPFYVKLEVLPEVGTRDMVVRNTLHRAKGIVGQEVVDLQNSSHVPIGPVYW